MNVEIVAADEEHKQCLHHLYQLYLHDLSEFTAENQMQENGLFDTDQIDVFWEKEGLYPLFIQKDGRTAGFAMVAGRPYTPREADYSVVEFFVLRQYRRHGVGKLAAIEIFDRFRGWWDVYELEHNQPAIRFWHSVIHKYTRGEYETLEFGNRQRFDNRPHRE